MGVRTCIDINHLFGRQSNKIRVQYCSLRAWKVWNISAGGVEL